MTRRDRPWTPYEVDLLRASYDRRVPWDLLSRAMKRPPEGLRSKARELGIITPRERKPDPFVRAEMIPDWQALSARLAWQYGPERAASILSAQDEATNADLLVWRTLGRTGRAA